MKKSPRKVIRSPGFGLMHFHPCVSELTETPEFQRLSSVRQLGPLYLVYPGGSHTRLLHTLEVSYVAEMIGRSLGLTEEENLYLATAGLLHDLGHGPYSHSTELLYHEIHKKDHMDYTCELITGETVLRVSPDEARILKMGQVPIILKKYGLNPVVVADLVRRRHLERPYLQDLIFGPIDADQLAFLMTDSRFMGLSYGNINLDTIAEFFVVKKLKDRKKYLCVHDKAVPAIKDVILSRLAMYNFYLTDTGLVVGNMLTAAARRALANGEISNFEILTDDEFRTHLMQSRDPFVREMAIRIKFRRLYKVAYRIAPIFTARQKTLLAHLREQGDRDFNPEATSAEEKCIDALSRLGQKGVREALLARLGKGIDPDSIMVNLKTLKELNLTEPRLKEARKIRILDETGGIRNLAEIAPFFTLYVENENVIPASFYVLSPPELRDRVRVAVEDLLSESLK